jgi:hypothetical protein
MGVIIWAHLGYAWAVVGSKTNGVMFAHLEAETGLLGNHGELVEFLV